MKFEILKFGDSYYVKHYLTSTKQMWLSRHLTLFHNKDACSTLEFSSEADAFDSCKRYKEKMDEEIKKRTGVLVRQIEL